MSRNIDDLTIDMQGLTMSLCSVTRDQGYEMRPFFTLRTPAEQAKLWRQSRSRDEIEKTIKRFQNRKYAYLAQAIQAVGPQNGPHVTNALPGLSWHQWGEAVDCFWLVDGKAEWSTRRKVNGRNGYAVYAQAARDLGLTAGGHWTRFKDWPHVQLRPASSPAKVYSMEHIDAEMARRFG